MNEPPSSSRRNLPAERLSPSQLDSLARVLHAIRRRRQDAMTTDRAA